MNTTLRQKAIATRYGGFRFRSMLEARWAVFFDALDIKYLYEPQGFVTDGKPYLPDFCLLLGSMVWAEVKPAFEADPDGVERWKSFVHARGEHGVLLTDMANKPGPFLYLGTTVTLQPAPGSSTLELLDSKEGDLPLRKEPWEDWAQWCACENGYHFQPVPACRYWPCADCSTEELAVDYLDDGYRNFKIKAAYNQARCHQFDRR